jgi:Tol biopolymer transport system component
MPVSTGSRIGPYQIVAPLGKGGMGEVYRAHDTRLGRDVAVKVLPPDRGDARRFAQEARAIASLNHPNILSIYDVGEDYLVTELIEGTVLRGQSFPLRKAIDIAVQVADGLAAAHAAGFAHRDLKPDNIMVVRDGRVKILDFGLAKPLAAAAEVDSTRTLEGAVLGTPGYMSPEQVRGQTADCRSDIFSFGVVLYEMLAGARAFSGSNFAEIAAATLKEDPPELPATVHPGVRELVRHCLDKDPAQRFQSAKDITFALRAMSGSGTSQTVAAIIDAADAAPERAPQKPRLLLWRVLPWILAAAAVVFAAWAQWHHNGASAREVMHLDITYPPDVEPVSSPVSAFALSRDGRRVAMVGIKSAMDGVRRLYIRRLDQADAIEIANGAGAGDIDFSPDGGSLVFGSTDRLIVRLSLSDQQRTNVVSQGEATGSVAWTSREIVYTGRGSTLWSVPAQGGTPRQLTVLEAARQEVTHIDAAPLPGTRTVLFTSRAAEPGSERIEAVSLDGGPRSVIIARAAVPVWSPAGYLLFEREGAVWAAPFDPKSATVRGAAVQVIPAGTVGRVSYGKLGFQLSATGTLVYAPAGFDYKRVVSVSRDGSELALDLPPNRYANPRISPDGRRLSVETEISAIETLDLLRGTRARLTAAHPGTAYSTWTADGRAIVFNRLNRSGLFWTATEGSGAEGHVPATGASDYPSSAGPDPDSILEVRIQPDTSGDVFLVSISGKFQPKALLSTPAYEGGAQLSPDKRWMLYQSNESGQPEIYVRRYPALDRRWQVSDGGGTQGRWSTAGREIFYRGGRHMISVAFDAHGGEPVFGKPAALFADEYAGQNASIPDYDVTRDGRFIMLRRTTNGGRLHVVTNWTEELKRAIAAGGVR